MSLLIPLLRLQQISGLFQKHQLSEPCLQMLSWTCFPASVLSLITSLHLFEPRRWLLLCSGSGTGSILVLSSLFSFTVLALKAQMYNVSAPFPTPACQSGCIQITKDLSYINRMRANCWILRTSESKKLVENKWKLVSLNKYKTKGERFLKMQDCKTNSFSLKRKIIFFNLTWWVHQRGGGGVWTTRTFWDYSEFSSV